MKRPAFLICLVLFGAICGIVGVMLAQRQTPEIDVAQIWFDASEACRLAVENRETHLDLPNVVSHENSLDNRGSTSVYRFADGDLELSLSFDSDERAERCSLSFAYMRVASPELEGKMLIRFLQHRNTLLRQSTHEIAFADRLPGIENFGFRTAGGGNCHTRTYFAVFEDPQLSPRFATGPSSRCLDRLRSE